MPDPVRPVAPREDELRQLIVKWREAAEWEVEQGSPEFGKGLDQCADELESALAVSPVPWAGSGAGMQEDLTRVDHQSLSERQDLPRKPQPEGSQR